MSAWRDPDGPWAIGTRYEMDAAGVLTEPSGAAGVAALMGDHRFAGLEVAAVVTGSNIDPSLYARLR